MLAITKYYSANTNYFSSNTLLSALDDRPLLIPENFYLLVAKELLEFDLLERPNLEMPDRIEMRDWSKDWSDFWSLSRISWNSQTGSITVLFSI